ncbi:hypothetical protein NTD84_19865 [Pseudomonas sp. 14P_8.1_Bac3]|uniref:hypothetical protein n=1 Tax=Pseudomonas sp. 14P_8.1_Bac3 TaxID=2971621 RepID=UPI0021CA5185|nr:hypothetical protein [Pseudomonas sp. 14P_8.1_Bac3]MCU1761964.1 hypothetical protein [Pseudomonas sp. 14P_8.1_Bac3]
MARSSFQIGIAVEAVIAGKPAATGLASFTKSSSDAETCGSRLASDGGFADLPV